ncbi:probable helicase MOV-10 at C-terminar half [Coccomyxa sp. Obi]|nr:probable helicase MOV-10 at C-terminar half [Coccomyxa sp. Obi]
MLCHPAGYVAPGVYWAHPPPHSYPPPRQGVMYPMWMHGGPTPPSSAPPINRPPPQPAPPALPPPLRVQHGETPQDSTRSLALVSSKPENSRDSSRTVSPQTPQNKQLLTLEGSGTLMSVLSQFDHIRSLLKGQLPKLPGPLLSAVTTCLMEARPRGYAPLALRSGVPRIPEGLADGSSKLTQDERSLDSRWCMMLLEDLTNSTEAKSNIHTYTLNLLDALKQAYLAGAPLPPFAENRPFYERNAPRKGKTQAGNSVKPDVAPHLESALLQLIQDPSLADPPEANSQLPPPVQGPPLGTPCNLSEEAGEWLRSRAFEKFQAAALKDMKHLLQDKGGLTVSEDVDFGSHQLTWPASSAEIHNSHFEPLPIFLARLQPPRHGHEGGRALHFRAMTVFNRSSTKAILADVRVVPARPHTFAVLDDVGISHVGVSITNGVTNGRSDPEKAVSLPESHRYLVTLVMDASEGPYRDVESGVLHALVLFTFLVPRVDGQDLCCALHEPSASGSRSCTCCAMLPSGSFGVTAIGRRVSVSLARQSEQIQSLLRVDARPFVTAALKGLFDQSPSTFHAGTLNLEPLFGNKGYDVVAPMAAAEQRGRALLRAGRADGAALSGVRQHTARYMQRLHRMLRLEESAMETDITRYDMFNVRLSYALVQATRRYMLYSTWPPGSEVKTNGRYLGPSLEHILPPALMERPFKLAVVDVPGLPEGRPALLLADTVYVRAVEEPGVEYAAVVVSVDSTLAFLAMPQQFWTSAAFKDSSEKSPKSPLFHVRFTFDRTPLRRMHAAIGEALNPFFETLPAPKDNLPDDLFAPAPQQALESGPGLDEVYDCADGISEEGMRVLNLEQRQAVASVLTGAGGGTPFALFGPPGTGKTVTLVECALQVLKRDPAAKLLLCAPQNYSADLLASALSGKVPVGDMIRLNDPRRPPNQVKADVLPYCKLSDTIGAFKLPAIDYLKAARVVVATCGAAGMLREGSYETKHLRFTHVLIDEAGQALLPEALVPLTLLRHKAGCRALLCGDPRQLGPVVRSITAATGGGVAEGLSVSLLERFIEAHQVDVPRLLEIRKAPATGMLVRNYRSHSSLLQIPNRLFYGDALRAAADQQELLPPHWDPRVPPLAKDGGPSNQSNPPEDGAAAHPDSQEGVEADGSAEEDHGEEAAEDGHSYQEDGGESEEDGLDAEQLPSTLFFGVRGQQMREGEAPSYFNAEEAAALVGLVEGLLAQTSAGGRQGVQPNDLGVIATYRKQVQKIRLALRERGLGAVRVGTVDDYQGQEERIIFISTVLSKRESLPPVAAAGEEADVHVGFWRNPKRFNVAITRARALLVVVGHPVVLMEDPSWRELLRFCALRGAYRGAGSELMAAMLRADGAEGGLFGFANALTEQPQGGEEGEEEMKQAVEAIAELALLGVGSADVMYPKTLDEAYAAYGNDEMEWRVVL